LSFANSEKFDLLEPTLSLHLCFQDDFNVKRLQFDNDCGGEESIAVEEERTETSRAVDMI